MSTFGGWPGELTERLRALWHANELSASQIARAFGISRNAVIGKAHRLKLGPHQSKTVGGKPKKLKIVQWKPVVPVEAIVIEPPPAPEFLGLTLLELKEASCRYPHGERSPFSYCGQPKQEGSAYCPYHHELCYVPSRRPVFISPPWNDYRGKLPR